MTKDELIAFLLPFDGEIDVMLTNGKHHYEIDHADYGIRQNGEGKAMLMIGARVLQNIRISEPVPPLHRVRRGIPPDHVFDAGGNCLYCSATQGPKHE